MIDDPFDRQRHRRGERRAHADRDRRRHLPAHDDPRGLPQGRGRRHPDDWDHWDEGPPRRDRRPRRRPGRVA